MSVKAFALGRWSEALPVEERKRKLNRSETLDLPAVDAPYPQRMWFGTQESNTLRINVCFRFGFSMVSRLQALSLEYRGQKILALMRTSAKRAWVALMMYVCPRLMDLLTGSQRVQMPWSR